MNISISQPVSLLQVGNRDLNEDYIFPSGEKSKRTTKLFVVADGLGGKGKGEVASKMATDIISDYILDLPTDKDLHQEDLNVALQKAEKALREYTTTNSASLGMGTSLSLIYLGPGLITMAWVGICPIYHFHEESGQLSRVNALSSEDKNTDQTDERIYGSHKSASFHLVQLSYDEISQGDYFLICSEGLLEKITERELKEQFDNAKHPEAIITDVVIEFTARESGNYSCHLFQVISVSTKDSPAPKKSKSAVTPSAVFAPSTKTTEVATGKETGTEVKKKEDKAPAKMDQFILWGVLGVIALVVVGLFIFNSTRNKNTRFGTYMELANEATEVKEFDRAIEMYDSAFFATEDPAERGTVSQLKADAMALRKANMLTVREYLRLAEANMEAEDFKAAVTDYKNAIEVDSQNGNPDDTPIPLEKVAEARIKYAHSLFIAENDQKNYQEILDLYQSAFDIYEENETLTAPRTPYYDLAVIRAKEAKGYLKGEGPSDEGLLADQTTRSMPTRGLQPDTRSTDDDVVGSLDDLNLQTKPEESTDTKATDTQPTTPSKETLADNASKSSTPATTPKKESSTSKLGPTRGTAKSKPSGSTLRTAKATPKGTQQQQYYVQQGKLAYQQGKNTGSFQAYQASITNLAAAGIARDGMASYYLAYMYHAGLGIAENPQMALKYAQESANKGWPSGYYLYAHILLERNNKVDSANAKKALVKGCEKGHRESCNRLNLVNR
ncbi:MAG: protein phosphatase 2C domain-containing protein [Bacteroidota bacterium]